MVIETLKSEIDAFNTLNVGCLQQTQEEEEEEEKYWFNCVIVGTELV